MRKLQADRTLTSRSSLGQKGELYSGIGTAVRGKFPPVGTMPFANTTQIDVFAQYNYTYLYANGSDYSNGTISNSSQCYMLREPFYPQIYPNGTILNGTGCSSPINVCVSKIVAFTLS